MDKKLHKEITVEGPITEYLKKHSLTIPDKVAISFYGQDISYKKLWQDIIKIAGSLRKIGIKEGDRIVLFMQNCPQFVISFFAVLQIGAVAVPVNPMLKQAELRSLLHDCDPTLLICHNHLVDEIPREAAKKIIVTGIGDFVGTISKVPIPKEMEDSGKPPEGVLRFSELLQDDGDWQGMGIFNLRQDALFVYTGGTTGLPKGAVHSHYELTWGALTSGKWYTFNDKDVLIVVLPLFHSFGLLNAMCAPLVSGCQLVILSRFDEEALLSAIAHYGVTVWFTVPTMISRVVNVPAISKYDLSSLRLINHGAMPMPSELRRKLTELFPETVIQEGYGLAEVLGYGIVQGLPGLDKEGYIGKATIGTEIKIVDLDTGNKELPPNQEGEVAVRCPTVMKGYWNKPEETTMVVREGWLYTGDIGKMDHEGYIALVGRKKEVIKVSGFSVFPAEIEDILCKHPAVMEACVVGVSDAIRGQIPKAFVVLKPEYKGRTSLDEITRWLKQNMAAYKQPRIVEFRDSLPKSAAGKILRRILLEEAQS
jgi:acyl-CoA synthetase (AMP-forming)/AMP-acid ligase II